MITWIFLNLYETIIIVRIDLEKALMKSEGKIAFVFIVTVTGVICNSKTRYEILFQNLILNI